MVQTAGLGSKAQIAVSVGQRVEATDPDTGKQRKATIVEVDERTKYARVCFDLKWMHDWLPLASLSPAPVTPSQDFYNVRDFIRDLQEGKFTPAEQSSDHKAKRPKLVEVTLIGGKRSFMLWGEIYKGYMWHWRNPENPKNIRWVSRHKQQAARRVPLSTPVRIGGKGLLKSTNLEPVNVQRLPLATPVRILSNGIEGVISAYASADSTRYQVTWFSRHFWAVRHVWVNRSNLEIIGSAADADNSAEPASAA